jgi:hypothetical protein
MEVGPEDRTRYGCAGMQQVMVIVPTTLPSFTGAESRPHLHSSAHGLCLPI